MGLPAAGVSHRISPLVQAILLFIALLIPGVAIERPGVEFKIFQFPSNKIPPIDGDPSDWFVVPETYSIGMDQLKETAKGRGLITTRQT